MENQENRIRHDAIRSEHEIEVVNDNGSDKSNGNDDPFDIKNEKTDGFVQYSYSKHKMDRMRRRLNFYFMNPWQKWKARKKFPYKLICQLIKLLFVTLQLILFGASCSSHVYFLHQTQTTFKSLFLKDWDSSLDVMPYPPVAGPFGVYTNSDFYDSMNYAIAQYFKVGEISFGLYTYNSSNNEPTNVSLCIYLYRTGQIFPNNRTFIFDPTIISDCYLFSNSSDEFDIKQYLKEKGKSLNFHRFVKAEITFTLNTIQLNQMSKLNKPDCLSLNTTILFDNTLQTGQILLSLDVVSVDYRCKGHIIRSESFDVVGPLRTSFDVFVILLSLASFALCTRSLYRSLLLRDITETFFKKYRNIEFTVWERLEFFDGWYCIIVIQDTLVIFGSIFKIAIDTKYFHSFETCGMCLGIGNLLMWFGVLRYLGFFEHYNILILTMKKAAPDMLRFVCCAAVFYVGYCLCGWIILGPFHIKFRDLMTTSECLFSLINGDDMFVTFSVISDQNHFVWWFSRIYLYTFICLFIYVVLSVFIAVIMDVYETIKHNSKYGMQKNRLRRFMEECQIDCDSPLYQSDERFIKFKHPFCGCSEYICLEEEDSVYPEDQRPLLNVNDEANVSD